MRAALLALFVTAADAPPPVAPLPPEQPLRAKMTPGQVFVCKSADGCYVLNDPGMDLVIRQLVEDVRGQCALRRIKL